MPSEMLVAGIKKPSPDELYLTMLNHFDVNNRSIETASEYRF